MVSCLMPTQHLDSFLDLDFTTLSHSLPHPLFVWSASALYETMCRHPLLFLILVRSGQTKAHSQSTHSLAVLKSTRTETAAPTCTPCY